MIEEYENMDSFLKDEGTYIDFFREKEFEIFEFSSGKIYGMDKNGEKLIFILNTHSFKYDENTRKQGKQSSSETIGGTNECIEL